MNVFCFLRVFVFGRNTCKLKQNTRIPFFLCLFVYFTVIFSYPTSFLGIVSIVLFIFVSFLAIPVVDSCCRLKAWRALVWWLLVWVTQSGSSLPPYICWYISNIFGIYNPGFHSDQHWKWSTLSFELCLLNLVDLWECFFAVNWKDTCSLDAFGPGSSLYSSYSLMMKKEGNQAPSQMICPL